MSYDKFDLRKACKLRGITGASAMTNLGMEQALGLPSREEGNEAIEAALQAILKSKPAAAEAAPKEPKPAKEPKAAKAPREPKVRTPNADSIKAYLQGVFASDGRVSIAEAIAHAAKTGRSKITVYVQAKQIGLSAARGTDNPDKGFFVKKKA